MSVFFCNTYINFIGGWDGDFILRYGLLGASACGKTTLISCILGRMNLQRGTINIFGTDISKDLSIIKKKVGYMPQVCDDAYGLGKVIKMFVFGFFF